MMISWHLDNEQIDLQRVNCHAKGNARLQSKARLVHVRYCVGVGAWAFVQPERSPRSCNIPLPLPPTGGQSSKPPPTTLPTHTTSAPTPLDSRPCLHDIRGTGGEPTLLSSSSHPTLALLASTPNRSTHDDDDEAARIHTGKAALVCLGLVGRGPPRPLPPGLGRVRPHCHGGRHSDCWGH